MKRVAILVGLAAGAVAVVMLLLSMESDDYKHERRTVEALDARGVDGEGSGEPGADARGTDGANAKRALDDDPNRIPGPDVTVRGIVLFDGVPLAGAHVQLLRAYPVDPSLAISWSDPNRRVAAPAPIAETVADENGRFVLSGARRSRIQARAWGDKTGVGTANLYVPHEGDPSEVIVRVGPAFELTGVVVNEEGKPVEGVKLTCSSSDWQSYPFLQETLTAADGRFGFGTLGRGSHTLIIEKDGYPTLHRSFAVPEATELRVELVVGGAVAGTIMSDSGSPVAGARLVLSSGDASRNAHGYAEAFTDDLGAFEIAAAPPGAIGLASIEHPDWGKRESQRGEVTLPRELIKAGEKLIWKIELGNGVTVQGIVVDKQTQKPVPNAMLAFMRADSGTRRVQPVRHEKTDADGRFAVAHVLEGTYAVDVRAEQHVRVIAQWVQPNQRMTTDFFVDGVKSPEPLRIEVGGSGRVEGQLRDEGTDDFSGTWIQIPELNNGLNARADATGYFVFENVPAGEQMRLKSWMPMAESEPFTLQAGEKRTVDLEAAGPPQFTGTVVGTNGEPVVGAYVKAAMASNASNEFQQILQNRGWGSARTDAQGRFSIRLQEWQLQQAGAQKWLLAAVSYEYPLQATEAVTLPKEGGSVDVQITLRPGGIIAGTVEFEGRGPVANAQVTVSPRKPEGAAAQGDARVGRYVFTDLAGRFRVEGIGAGDWNVTTHDPDGKAEPQTAAAGDTAVNLVFKPTLALAGIVVDEDDAPLAQVRVSAIVQNGKNEQRQTATTDAAGRFRIAQLDAGDYELEVTPSNNQQMYYGGGQTAGGFKTTRTQAYPAGTESIVIEVEPGNKIAGRLVDQRGKPVGGATVMALPLAPLKGPQPGQPVSPRSEAGASSAFSDGRGGFTLKGVGDGQYEIVAIASGYMISTAQATVGQTDVTITLGDGATLEGMLLAPDGEPMGGQWINLQSQDPEIQKKFSEWSQRGGNSWNNMGGWQATATTTKPDGTFKATGLFPGKYKLNIYTERGVVPNTELHTDSGKTTIRLTEGVSITGRVLDEAGNVPVVPNGQLWISANANGQWKSAQADAEGNFELKGLPSGAVKIQVWAGNAYNATTVDAQGGDRGVRITLTKRAPPTPK